MTISASIKPRPLELAVSKAASNDDTNPDDLFAIVPVQNGVSSDNAILIGFLSTILEYLPDTHARNESIARLDEGQARAAKVDQLQAMARACNVMAFADAVKRLTGRLDAFAARRQEKARRDAEEAERKEAERIQAQLDSLPDPDDPDPLAHHEVPPSEKPEPPLELESGTKDQAGDLPEELEDLPEPETEPKGPPPTAIQANED
jgi:hypothetical protein